MIFHNEARRHSLQPDLTTVINTEMLSDEALRTRLALHAQEGGRVGIRPDARLKAQRLVQLSGVLRQAGF